MRCDGAVGEYAGDLLRTTCSDMEVAHSARTPTDSTPPGEDVFRPTVLKILELAGTTRVASGGWRVASVEWRVVGRGA